MWYSALREKIIFEFSAVAENFGKKTGHQAIKILKTLWTWFSEKVSFAFYVFINSHFLIIKNSRVLAGIYFIFLKNALDQTWMSFNTKLETQWKDPESSYQDR